MNDDTRALAQAWGDAIKVRRKMLGDNPDGLPQAELARQLGVTPVTVWRWEHAKGVPSQAMQAKLVRILRIDPKTLHDLVTSTDSAA